MPQKSLVSHVRLTQYPTYEQKADSLERCPSCHGEDISKKPRRSPALFHCMDCGFIANLDNLYYAHWMLGQRAV